MPAGYCITDGGVIPSSDKSRIDANLEKIRQLNPDIICLYEVVDVCDAEYISTQLPEYPFLIPAAGTRAIGPSSMLYIASKYKIAEDSITFTPFTKGDELTGRARYSEKGFLSFDIIDANTNTPIATIFSTHLQHAEVPADPDKSEKKARTAQMSRIANQIKTKMNQSRAIIFTGDLNLDENELNAFLLTHKIDWLKRDPKIEELPP